MWEIHEPVNRPEKPNFPEIWPPGFDGSSYIALDESMFFHLDLPNFKKEYIISYAIVIAPSPELEQEPQAINVLNINPKYVHKEKRSQKKAEIKQKDRFNLAEVIENKSLSYNIDKDIQLWACKFFSDSGPPWLSNNNHRYNLLHNIENNFKINYPSKLVQRCGDGYLEFHYCPILYAHQHASKYNLETKQKLEKIFTTYERLNSGEEVMEEVCKLDGHALNNGIKGTIFVSPLLVREMAKC